MNSSRFALVLFATSLACAAADDAAAPAAPAASPAAPPAVLRFANAYVIQVFLLHVLINR